METLATNENAVISANHVMGRLLRWIPIHSGCRFAPMFAKRDVSAILDFTETQIAVYVSNHISVPTTTPVMRMNIGTNAEVHAKKKNVPIY